MSSMTGSMGYRGLGGNSSQSSRSGDIIPKGYKLGQLQQYTPEQMQLFQQQFGQVGPDSYLSKLAGGDEAMFEQMEAPAHRQFNEKLGGIASRFSGMGLGGRQSSAFQNESTAAASNFAQDLAARRQDLQRQATQDLFSMSQQILGNRPEEKFLVEKYRKPQQSSGWGGVGGAALGAAAGYFAGDPLTGAKIGYNVGSSF